MLRPGNITTRDRIVAAGRNPIQEFGIACLIVVGTGPTQANRKLLAPPVHPDSEILRVPRSHIYAELQRRLDRPKLPGRVAQKVSNYSRSELQPGFKERP